MRRHPVSAFLLWFFTVGQAWAFAPWLLGRVGVVLAVPPQLFILGSTLTGLLLPALVITAVVDGRAAAAGLMRRAVDLGASWRWYALALLAAPVLALAITAAVLGMPVELSRSAWAEAVVGGLAVQLVLTLLPNNLWEEVAWAGFVQERLQRRYAATLAAGITGVLFALQHVALLVGNAPVDAVIAMTLLVLLVVPFRFLTGWVFNATGSLFVVGLLHAMGNAVAGGSGFGAGLLPRLYPGAQLPLLAHLLAFAVIGLVVVAATRGRLGTARSRPGSAPPHRSDATHEIQEVLR